MEPVNPSTSSAKQILIGSYSLWNTLLYTSLQLKNGIFLMSMGRMRRIASDSSSSFLTMMYGVPSVGGLELPDTSTSFGQDFAKPLATSASGAFSILIISPP